MTHNQIAYANLKETQRANLTREKETERSNRAQESLGVATLKQRAYEYADMAPYKKAEAVTKSAKHVAETVRPSGLDVMSVAGLFG